MGANFYSTGHSSQQENSSGYRDMMLSFSVPRWDRWSQESRCRRQPYVSWSAALAPPDKIASIQNAFPRPTLQQHEPEVHVWGPQKVLHPWNLWGLQRMSRTMHHESTIFWTAVDNFCHVTCWFFSIQSNQFIHTSHHLTVVIYKSLQQSREQQQLK